MKTKVIKLQPVSIERFPEKLTIEDMKRIWNEDGKEYSDQQLLMIREFVYLLLEHFVNEVKEKENIVITLNPLDDESKKSDTVHQGEYRRAS